MQWARKLLELGGIYMNIRALMACLRSTHNNHRYSKEFKLSLVQQYQKSDASLEIFAIKHGLKSKTQLSDWIMQYNESNLKVRLYAKKARFKNEWTKD